MLHTLQYYDSIRDINGSYDIKSEQELIIPEPTYSQVGPSELFREKHEIGTAYTRGQQNIRVFNISQDLRHVGGSKYKDLLATSDKDRGPSDYLQTLGFIRNYLSHRHYTKYLAWQASEYVNQELQKKGFDNDPYGALNWLPDFEHIIQEFVLHGGDTKSYLIGDNIGQKVFKELIQSNSKCVIFFKDHGGIDLENIQKLPEYERRWGKNAFSRGESNAYRNDPVYQEANKNFHKRD